MSLTAKLDCFYLDVSFEQITWILKVEFIIGLYGAPKSYYLGFFRIPNDESPAN